MQGDVVELWVEEQQNSESNCVLLFKRQGEESNILQCEDFCLIIMNQSQQHMLRTFGSNIIAIDSTHGLNPYNFELTTLLVIDEHDEGFPCVCMFSNRQDTYIF